MRPRGCSFGLGVDAGFGVGAFTGAALAAGVFFVESEFESVFEPKPPPEPEPDFEFAALLASSASLVFLSL